MSKKFSLLIALCLSLLLAAAFSVADFARKSQDLSSQVLRMHVVANSDSPADQQLKLEVRDAILQAGSELFDGSVDTENAYARLSENRKLLQDAGEKVIADSGLGYPLTVELTREYFPTRTYDDKTLPAGNYTAIKAIIGGGAGENWWCVMFPPLCLPAVQVAEEEYFDSDSREIINSDPRIEVRFKLLEWFFEVRERMEKSETIVD
ncbi:MAG: stage II sporulation protein R [Oscillospiraceae bacterium]|nr:stage II sporulation protein R [Oscillospiraceae bacterium]